MKEGLSYLDCYPLEECHILCEQYLRRIDWDTSYEEIKKSGVSYFDVSDVIRLFPHLELDENYKLLCYLGREYHGIYGKIAAIANGADIEPVFDDETERTSKIFHGKNFKLPDGSVPPMEAIYNDGTDDGYFEAVLCTLFIKAIPYAHFRYKNRNIIMDNPPPDLKENWERIVPIEDWMPRRVNNSIIAFKRQSSDEKDRIYLTQFNFQSKLEFYHAFITKNHQSMYRNQIDDDKRYNENRHCCVFTESSVLVAEEI